MRYPTTAMVWLLSGLAFQPAALAIMPDTQGSAYEGIVSRNVFGLKPIEAPEPVQPPAPPLPKVIVAGITTILGNKRVLLKVQIPARPPEPPIELSPILTEGQREGIIEVLAIDERAGTVRLLNSGIEMTLSIDKDGPKNGAAPGATAVAAGGPGAGNTLPMPGTRPRGWESNAAVRHLANLTMNPRGTASPPAPSAAPAVLEPPPAPNPPAPVPAAVPGQPLTPEQEAVLTELEREAVRK